MRLRARWAACARVVVLCACGVPATVAADPLRLRADALATSNSPVGLLALGGDATRASANGLTGPATTSVEALLWLAPRADDDSRVSGDAMVMTVGWRRNDRRVEAKLGRWVQMLGALPPQHVDGGYAKVRMPARIDVEAFAGTVVAPRFGASRFDWVAGARLARRVGDWGGVGIAALERRDEGRLAYRYWGLDASAAQRQSSGAARIVIGNDGALADAQIALTHRLVHWRFEASVQRRVAALLLPRTSLFAVLGDLASDRAGGRVQWRAAPRLDVILDGGLRRIDAFVGPEGSARANLRLDREGRGLVAVELRRLAAVDGGFVGGRMLARVPLGALVASGEVELVRPDIDRGGGAFWPWALTALGWSHGNWRTAVAFEGGATPSDRYRFDVLAQLGYQWEAP